jgi:hypothetical protein
MQFKVQTQEGEISLSQTQLLDILMSKHMSVHRKDFEVLSLEFARFMQHKEALHEASLLHLLLISFSLGYFYRVFKEKNSVEVVNESTDDKVAKPSSS